MEQNLPQPTYRLDTPASGWWKAPSAIGTDPAFLRVSEALRPGALGLYIAAIGWCLMHNSTSGWIPDAAISSGQVISGDKGQLASLTHALVNAGIWAVASLDGLEGYVVAGAAKAVEERFARQENARRAGQTSAQGKNSQISEQKDYRRRPTRPDANAKVDWSNVSGEL